MGWRTVFIWLTIAKCWELIGVPITENERYDRASKRWIKVFGNADSTKYVISGAESEMFEVDTVNGADQTCSMKYCGILWLKDGVTADREEKDEYTITVTALNKNGMTVEESPFTITVDDENDNKPVFTSASKTLHCQENLSDGASCGRVEAKDKDAGVAGKVEYTLASRSDTWRRRDGTLETKSLGMFSIDPVTGMVTLRNPSHWDAEKYEYVEISVSAQDAPGKSARNPPVTATIRIYIDDVNDHEPNVIEYSRTIKVGELTSVGTAIGTEAYGGKFSFRADDDDIDLKNSRVTFQINTASAPFEITNQGDPENSALLLIAKKGLDYETQKRWSLEIIANNTQGSPQRTTRFSITVDVEDENEPPIWSDSHIEFMEGDVAGAKPKGDQPFAKDLDFNGSQKVTYRITNDPLGFFDIDRNSGQLSYAKTEPLDRECAHPYCNYDEGTYALELEACDDQGACAKKVHAIYIEDINDEGPRVEFTASVCNILDQSYVVIKGQKNIKAIDRDDCQKDHCGPFKIGIVGQYRTKFDLHKINDDTFWLRHTDQKQLPVGETLHIQVSGTDASGNKHDSVITLNVCRCSDAFDEADCGLDAAIADVGGHVPSILAIILAVLIVFSVVVVLIFVRMRSRGPEKSDALIDDVDDERANIMAYHHEGGGEEDQTDYDPESLVRAKHQKNSLMKTRPVKPSLLGPGIPPEDIGQYINAAKSQADEDPSSPPYDSLLTFDYEGGNSLCGDLSDIASNSSDYDEDMNLDNWRNPKFRKLADLYAGRENDAYNG